jgi:hypothetical protein
LIKILGVFSTRLENLTLNNLHKIIATDNGKNSKLLKYDILITETGNKNLSAGSPRTVEAIEKMAKEKSIFKK